jgi:hypothetical protein
MVGRHINRKSQKPERKSSRTPAAARRRRNRPAGEDVKRADQRYAASQLRAKGCTFRGIAQELRCSVSTAHLYVNEWLEETQALRLDIGQQYVTLELERLDGLLWALRDEIDRGDPYAVDVARKLSESRRRLLGLDAPTKIARTTPDGQHAHPTAMDLSLLSEEDLEAMTAIMERYESLRAPNDKKTATSGDGHGR